jgi:hypothetical protein
VNANEPAKAPRRQPGSYWAFVPAGLLAAMLVGLLTMATIAADDPSFAVERDYYKKAVAWDRELEQQGENARLARMVTLETRSTPRRTAALALRISDASGTPLDGASVDLEAFPNARAGERQRLVFTETRPGAYVAELAVTRTGLWELRLIVTRGKERTTHVLRVDFDRESGA